MLVFPNYAKSYASAIDKGLVLEDRALDTGTTFSESAFTPGALSIRPNIPVSNSGYSMRRMEHYFPVSWNNQSQIIRFQISRENTRSNGGLFYLCFLALGLFDDSEVEINDVLGEGDNITVIVRI